MVLRSGSQGAPVVLVELHHLQNSPQLWEATCYRHISVFFSSPTFSCLPFLWSVRADTEKGGVRNSGDVDFRAVILH